MEETLEDARPLLILQDVAHDHGWDVTLSDSGDLCFTVDEFQFGCSWVQDKCLFHLMCSFPYPTPEKQETQSETLALIFRINTHLWVGHFDLFAKDDVVTFRHGHVLSPDDEFSFELCQTLVRIAHETCALYKPAFDLVLQGAEEHVAFQSVHMVPEGKA